MAKKPVKKSSTVKAKAVKSVAKKSVKKPTFAKATVDKAVKKTASTSAKKMVKKVAPKSKLGKKTTAVRAGAKKPVVRKPLTERELDQRAANVIANTEKKNAPGKSKSPKKTSTKEERPKKNASSKETITLLDAVVEGMQERKAKNIMILNLTGIEARVADYFVICDADSKTHVESIGDSVEETVIKLTSEKAYHTEGQQNSEWILVDYINIVAHVFLKEFRDLYNLEALWGDAEITLINN